MTLSVYKSLLRTNSTARLLHTVARGIVRSSSTAAKPVDDVYEIPPKAAAKSSKRSEAGAAPVIAPANVIAWNDPVDSLKGVGVKTKEYLSALGIATLGQLLAHYPHSAVDRRHRVQLSNSLVGQVVSFDMVVEDVKLGYKTSPFIITGRDLGGSRVSVTYFFGNVGQKTHFHWTSLADVFQVGRAVVVSGKLAISAMTSMFNIVNPDFAVLATNEEALKKALVVEPVYSLTTGLTATKLRSTIFLAQRRAEDSFLYRSDWIPVHIREMYKWPTLREALLAAHSPASVTDVMAVPASADASSAWKKRLAFDRVVAQKLRGITPSEIDLVHLNALHLRDAQQIAANLEQVVSARLTLRASSDDSLQVHHVLELLSVFTGAASSDAAVPKAATRTRAKSESNPKYVDAAGGSTSGSSSVASAHTERAYRGYIATQEISLEDIVNDPNFDIMDHENDPLMIMHALGIDRDEVKVRLNASKPSNFSTEREREEKRAKNVFEETPLVDLLPASNTCDAEPCIILLDLETTGLRPATNRIIQIAAKVLGQEDSMFNAYVLPVGDTVSDFIADLTGIEQKFLEVEGTSFENAYAQFRDWLLAQRQGAPGSPPRPLLLLAHNGKNFDFDFLTIEVDRHKCLANSEAGSWPEDGQVTAFADSLLILRDDDAWLEKKYKPSSLAQGRLYKHLLHRDLDNGHNAKYDILALEEILLHPVLADTWRRVGNRMQFTLPPLAVPQNPIAGRT